MIKVRLIRFAIVIGVAGVLNSLSFAQNTFLQFRDPQQVLSGTQYTDYRLALANLKASFDRVCGDTFCEGDFSNLTSMDITCSLNTKTEKLQACAWTFAGVNAEVDTATGIVDASNQMMAVCNLDVSQVPLQEFITAINESSKRSPSVRGGMDVIFAGKSKSIYDQIADCL